MTDTYLLTSTKWAGELAFSYDDLGILVKFENRATLTEDQLLYLTTRFPLYDAMLQNLVEVSLTLTVHLIPPDLSFDAFWEAYGYKIGNKIRTRKLWNELPDSDRILALKSLNAYARYLMLRPTMERLYPETYLAQRRFENDYKQPKK